MFASDGETGLTRQFNFLRGGGGHVGQALAASLALLPIHVVVVETRTEALEDMPETVETKLTPMPEAVLGKATTLLPYTRLIDANGNDAS